MDCGVHIENGINNYAKTDIFCQNDTVRSFFYYLIRWNENFFVNLHVICCMTIGIITKRN